MLCQPALNVSWGLCDLPKKNKALSIQLFCPLMETTSDYCIFLRFTPGLRSIFSDSELDTAGK